MKRWILNLRWGITRVDTALCTVVILARDTFCRWHYYELNTVELVALMHEYELCQWGQRFNLLNSVWVFFGGWTWAQNWLHTFSKCKSVITYLSQRNCGINNTLLWHLMVNVTRGSGFWSWPRSGAVTSCTGTLLPGWMTGIHSGIYAGSSITHWFRSFPVVKRQRDTNINKTVLKTKRREHNELIINNMTQAVPNELLYDHQLCSNCVLFNWYN